MKRLTAGRPQAERVPEPRDYTNLRPGRLNRQFVQSPWSSDVPEEETGVDPTATSGGDRGPFRPPRQQTAIPVPTSVATSLRLFIVLLAVSTAALYSSFKKPFKNYGSQKKEK